VPTVDPHLARLPSLRSDASGQGFSLACGHGDFDRISISPRSPEHGAPHRETGLFWAFSGEKVAFSLKIHVISQNNDHI
jgi:hypothetical protein